MTDGLNTSIKGINQPGAAKMIACQLVLKKPAPASAAAISGAGATGGVIQPIMEHQNTKKWASIRPTPILVSIGQIVMATMR